MKAGLDKPVRLHAELQRRCLNASAEHAKSLTPGVLRQIEMAQIAVWVDAQDPSIDAGALVHQVHAAMNAINARYPT